jgi:prophage regulatory protein
LRAGDALTGITRAEEATCTIYQYIKDGVFPKPVPLGPCAVGWLESDVSEWIAGRVKIARDGSIHRCDAAGKNGKGDAA